MGEVQGAPQRSDACLPTIKRPWITLACLAVTALMILLFVFDGLPNPIAPAEAAILSSALLLLVAFGWELDPVRDIVRDVDWESLFLFFFFVSVMVGALDKTGIIGALGSAMGVYFGDNVIVASLLLLFGIGTLSFFSTDVWQRPSPWCLW